MMPNTLVQTSSGMVQGVQEGTISSWKGIPYARPPLGEQRFRAPQPPEAWPGVLQTTHFGPMAMQPPSMPDELLRRRSMSEDCLTLNYRLGPFGFLHLAEFGGAEYAASGNCGILDQVAALQWVQENIATFGGDPQRVTVFGESAGAMSIGTLLALPVAQSLFQQAILQSGTVGPIRSDTEATTLARTFLKILDVSPEALSTLEHISAERLVEAASVLPDWQGTTGAGEMIHFAPVIDGVILPQPPLRAIVSGMVKHIPIIVGTTKDECLFYPFADPTWREADDETLIRRVKQQVGAAWPSVAPFYLGNQSDEQPLLKRLLALLTFNQFIFPAIQFAEAQVRQGAPVWVYRFDWYSPLFGGAAHTLDRIFVWNLAENPTIQHMTGDAPERVQLAQHMQRAWIAFARAGDPTIPELPTWPRYDLEQRATMLFDRESTVQNDPNVRARQIWVNESSMRVSL
jgi:para-nitrobenzyl esterase